MDFITNILLGLGTAFVPFLVAGATFIILGGIWAKLKVDGSPKWVVYSFGVVASLAWLWLVYQLLLNFGTLAFLFGIKP
jgi:hypothetical protein